MGDTLANTEIVTIAVYLLGGQVHPVGTEEVAMKAYSLAPGRFSWRKYKDQVNLDAVRKRLWDAKSKKVGFLSGSESEGWMLTEAGVLFAKPNAKKATPATLSGEPLNESDRKWRRRERERMLSSDAYIKWSGGKADSVTRSEAESFFRIDEYVTGAARDRKITRLLNTFREDAELGRAVEALGILVRRGEKDGNR